MHIHDQAIFISNYPDAPEPGSEGFEGLDPWDRNKIRC